MLRRDSRCGGWRPRSASFPYCSDALEEPRRGDR